MLIRQTVTQIYSFNYFSVPRKLQNMACSSVLFSFIFLLIFKTHSFRKRASKVWWSGMIFLVGKKQKQHKIFIDHQLLILVGSYCWWSAMITAENVLLTTILGGKLAPRLVGVNVCQGIPQRTATYLPRSRRAKVSINSD